MILDDLRDAIRDSGLSLREIERQTGVDNGNLSRLMSGRSLGISSVERVCELLRLRLSAQRPGQRQR